MTTKALDDLETCYIQAITNWHKFYNALPQEERTKLYTLNKEMHNVFSDMQDIIRITRFGTDDDIKKYKRKI